MAAIVDGYEYDVFISYRQKDNKYDGWVTDFVTNLKRELEATFKEEISVYFDVNPHDGLLESHDVDASLKSKLKCLVFIPILSQTYCDPRSFAWKSELVPFVEQSAADRFGLIVRLPSGNMARRVIPVKIHAIDEQDVRLLSETIRGELRYIDFTYQSPGVNRPLRSKDDGRATDGLVYRDQINKVANALKEILYAMRREAQAEPRPQKVLESAPGEPESLLNQFRHRRILRVTWVYAAVAVLITQTAGWLTKASWVQYLGWLFVALFPVAMYFAWNYEWSPQGIVRIQGNTTFKNPFDFTRRKPLTSPWVMVLLLILLAGQTLYFRYDAWFGSGPNLPANIDPNSIAVLPLKNMSMDRENEYFSDGLTEDIITHLSKISSIKVISRSSIIGYKDHPEPLVEIATTLGVAKILEGSVQRADDRMRVRVQLVDVFSNTPLWAETYDRQMGDVFSMQSEMAKRIAAAMKANMSDAERNKIDKVPTRSITAYDYYLRGRELYYAYNEVSNAQAIDEFRRAIALDSTFALAWSGLGDAYSQLHGRFGKQVEWIDSSLIASRRALQLDPNLSEGHKALANAYNYINRYDLGFPPLLKAVELNPNNAQAVGNLGTSYFLRGELKQALHWEKKAAGLNPKSFIPFQIVGWTYRLLGQYDQAEEWLKRSLALRPFRDTYEQLALCYVAKGENKKAMALISDLLELGEDYAALETAGLIACLAGEDEDAETFFRKAIELHTGVGSDVKAIAPIYLGHLLQKRKDRVESEVYLNNAFDLNIEAMRNGSQDDEHAFYLAAICSTKGQVDEAIDWLRVARGRRWLDYSLAVNNPLFEPVSRHPDFLALMDSVRSQTIRMRE